MLAPTNAKDTNSNTIVTQSASWVGGSPIDPCDSAMDFDGVSDYVVCAERDGNNPGTYPAELMPDKFTISCWTRLDAFTWYGGFVSNGFEDGPCGFFLQGGGNGNNFGLSMMTESGGWWDVETPTIYDTDRWYHLAATYNGQDVNVYVDGELAAGPENVGSPIKWLSDSNDYPSNFVIGSWKDEGYTGAGLPVDGIIDDVRFYNYALPEDDIKVLAGYVPGAATNPNPRYGAKDAQKYTDLSWTPGDDANSHDVYFGTSESEVADANIDVNFGVYMGRQDATVFSNSNLVPALELGETYYWRIDEVNETADTLIKGRVWSFTVANYIIVDDFDSYVSTEPDLDAVWNDYWDNGSDATITLEKDPGELGLVREGNSVAFNYYNTSTKSGKLIGSWMDASTSDLEIGSDWTLSSAAALVLYFRGSAGNSVEKMWVELEDTSTNAGYVFYDGDANDITVESWHEWNIDLGIIDACGVTLSSLDNIKVGVGGQVRTGNKNAGTSSYVYFDDIRVWQQRCVPDLAQPYGDLTVDCVIDGFDVEAMSDDWLVHDYNVTATEPCDANLMGWWKFDEGDGNTVTDSSAYNNNGATVSPTPSWVAGYPNDPCDSAMYFDGLSDYYDVVCAERVGSSPGTYPAELMPDTFTISCWVKFDTFLAYAALITSGVDGECGFYLWSATDDGVGDFGLSMYTESGGWMDVMPTDIHDTMTWYHIAVSYDGQYANFYVDGLLIEGPQDVGGPIRWINAATGNFPDHFIIGAWEDEWWSSQVDGVIDEVRFYNYALQPGEIAVLAGLQGSIYVPLDVPANLVPKDPCDSADPNLGTGAFDPNNMDIVNFKDYDVMADNWLKEYLFP